MCLGVGWVFLIVLFYIGNETEVLFRNSDNNVKLFML